VKNETKNSDDVDEWMRRMMIDNGNNKHTQMKPSHIIEFLLPLFAFFCLQVERCEVCTGLRTKDRDYTNLLGLPRLERQRQGITPGPGERSACYCNVCDGQLDQERELWKEHYFDSARWQVGGGGVGGLWWR
jgi:hypothetical protein